MTSTAAPTVAPAALRLGTEGAFAVLARARALERAARDGGGRARPHARRRHCAGAGDRRQRCEALPALRCARDLRAGRRGRLTRPRLPDLRVGDPLRRRHAGPARAPRGRRLRVLGRRARGEAVGPHAARDPQLAAEPDRRRARPLDARGGRGGAARVARLGAVRRGVRAAALRGRVLVDRERARDARADDRPRQLLEDLCDDRLAVRLRGRAGGARRAADAVRRELDLVRAAVRAAGRDRGAHRPAGRGRGDARRVPRAARPRRGRAERAPGRVVPRAARGVLRVPERRRRPARGRWPGRAAARRGGRRAAQRDRVRGGGGEPPAAVVRDVAPAASGGARADGPVPRGAGGRLSDDSAAAPEAGLDVRAIAKRGALFAAIAIAAAVGIGALPGVGEVRERLASADPRWLVAAAACAVGSMLGFVRALWAAFDRVVPWRRALVLGLAEQGANVLLPAGGAGGPAFGTFVMRRVGVPGELAAPRHAALFLATSAVGFFALLLAS